MERVESTSSGGRIVRKTNGEFKSRFPLPHGLAVDEVVCINSDIPEGLLCFEAPISRAWLKMYSLNGIPETEREVKWMLRAGYERFHRPVWYIMDDVLFLFPPAPCYSSLVVNYADTATED